jgi:hypothetical protein
VDAAPAVAEAKTAARTRKGRKPAAAAGGAEDQETAAAAKAAPGCPAASEEGGNAAAPGAAVARETTGDNEEAGRRGRAYWLLKAEPESRFENGVDVKFSIDDLAARTEPEPWDGAWAGLGAVRRRTRDQDREGLAMRTEG